MAKDDKKKQEETPSTGVHGEADVAGTSENASINGREGMADTDGDGEADRKGGDEPARTGKKGKGSLSPLYKEFLDGVSSSEKEVYETDRVKGAGAFRSWLETKSDAELADLF